MYFDYIFDSYFVHFTLIVLIQVSRSFFERSSRSTSFALTETLIKLDKNQVFFFLYTRHYRRAFRARYVVSFNYT